LLSLLFCLCLDIFSIVLRILLCIEGPLYGAGQQFLNSFGLLGFYEKGDFYVGVGFVVGACVSAWGLLEYGWWGCFVL
jgi:hypothetical protein